MVLHMFSKVSGLKLTDSDTYLDESKNPLAFLQPISTINIFVGANNSGKSRLMRRLASQAEYRVLLRDMDKINESVSSTVKQLRDEFDKIRMQRIGDVNRAQFDHIVDKLIRTEFLLKEDSYKELRDIIRNWSLLEVESPTVPPNTFSRQHRQNIFESVKRAVTDITDLIEEIPVFSDKTTPKRVYIPILRGLRPLNETHTDFYTDATKSTYFPDETEPQPTVSGIEELEIFSGLTFFQKLTELLLGDNRERQLIVKYQEFLSKTLFEGKSISLIPSKKRNVIVVKIGREFEQPIHHLGDGIQSALILSFLPFVTERPGFFFIEEPEMLMHPGLQRKILEFFASFDRHIFFLTTHSNHFLDLTADVKNVSVFAFNKDLSEEEDESHPSFSIAPLNSGNESSLELLGVRNSSVFLVNATIWVEGITDRLYFRRMLELFVKHLCSKNQDSFIPEEDVHYSFVEYGGANIVHWSFLDLEIPQINVDRLCAKALVVADKDGASKLERKEALKKKLGSHFIELPTREVENLLSFDVIRQVVLELEKSPRKIRSFSSNDYKDVYLGEFIEKQMLESKPKRKGGYKEKSGTLKGKLQFCQKALPKMDYESLPAAAKTFVKKLFDFVDEQNSK